MCAKVVAKKEAIDQVAGLCEKEFVGLIVELAHAVGDGLDQFRVLVHVDQIALHAKQVHHVVVKGRPKAAGAIVVAGVAQGIQHLGEIEVL